MTAKEVATALARVIERQWEAVDDASLVVEIEPVREDGHGVNFIVTDPDGARHRVIVTEP